MAMHFVTYSYAFPIWDKEGRANKERLQDCVITIIF
jgi:hypothetical protein